MQDILSKKHPYKGCIQKMSSSTTSGRESGNVACSANCILISCSNVSRWVCCFWIVRTILMTDCLLILRSGLKTHMRVLHPHVMVKPYILLSVHVILPYLYSLENTLSKKYPMNVIGLLFQFRHNVTLPHEVLKVFLRPTVFTPVFPVESCYFFCVTNYRFS